MTLESTGTCITKSSSLVKACHIHTRDSTLFLICVDASGVFFIRYTKKGKFLTANTPLSYLAPIMYMYEKLTVTPLPPTILSQVGYIFLLHVSLYPP